MFNNTMDLKDKATKITEQKITDLLNWIYEKAQNGLPGLNNADVIAKEYLIGTDPLDHKVKKMVRWQIAKASGTGFITGLGGLLTLPVTVPADLASILFIHVRMTLAIAKMYGHDVNSDQIRSMVYICLLGNSAKDVLKEVSIVIGKKLAVNAIKNISGKTITQINQKVGFRLLTKFGEKGVINLCKTVPLLGGVIGGTVDGFSTKAVGSIAITIFKK